MINILPENDLKEHTEDSTCACKPRVIFEEGEMIVIHNSYDGRELLEDLSFNQRLQLELTPNNLTDTIISNTDIFIDGVNKGELSLGDLESMLKQAEEEEEYEVAISIKNSIEILNKK